MCRVTLFSKLLSLVFAFGLFSMVIRTLFKDKIKLHVTPEGGGAGLEQSNVTK
jgi:hypothetical protein